MVYFRLMNMLCLNTVPRGDACYKVFGQPDYIGIGHSHVGTWYLSLAASLLLILIGLYVHWSVVLFGLVLPFIPIVSFLMMRRASRKRGDETRD
jgi:hypothetical protein